MVEYMTLGEVAREFGVAKGTIRHWVKKGLLYSIESIDVVQGRRMIFFSVRDVNFLKKVIKSVPPDKRHGRRILEEYRHMVEKEWRRASSATPKV
jgi:predicted transcriptional regulator